MMRTNVLNDQTLNSKSGIGPVHLSPELGFGYDFAVMRDPAALKSPFGKGTYWWWGIAGTWFFNDPANDLLFIGMIQRRGGAPGAANHEDLGPRGCLQGARRPVASRFYTITPSVLYHGVIMALNLKNDEVERLAAEVAGMTGESKTEAIRVALQERQQRLKGRTIEQRRDRVLKFLEKKVWPTLPEGERGSAADAAPRRTRSSAFGPDGV